MELTLSVYWSTIRNNNFLWSSCNSVGLQILRQNVLMLYCNYAIFSVDCEWSTWSSWSECSADCSGTTKRTRTIVSDSAYGGVPCDAEDFIEESDCNVGSQYCSSKQEW